MSNLVLPQYDGLSPVIKRRPVWDTRIDEAWNGQETAVSRRAWPRWRYTVSYDVLRAEFGELEALLGFYNAHRGRGDDFLVVDPDYNAVSNQAFGIGDGVTTTFQLVRALDGWLEPVWAPIAAGIAIKKNGVTQGSGYTLGSYGAVQFSTAPAVGVSLSWSGSYHMRCRFERDDQEFERFLQGLSKTGSVDLISKVFA